MNLTELQVLLKELTEKYPPGIHQAHGVLLRSDGKPGLMINVVYRGKFMTYNLDEEDLSKNCEEFRKELFDVMEATVDHVSSL